jgi:Zn-dependent metalloprotease
VVRTTAQIGNLHSSISGGTVKSFKGGTNTDVTWAAHLYLDEDNAYYYNSAIYFGNGFVTDDVIAHEWEHGYTAYSSGYNYEFQSGAMNEAMSDIFGEALDILNEQFDVEGDMTSRSSIQQCTQDYAYGSRGGTDGSRKWIIGEDCDLGSSGDGLRDMYFPECYLDPSHTHSDNYFCADSASDHFNDWDDSGGVHYNSGVVNRLFAVAVDGGAIELLSSGATVTVAGIGMEKALGLVAESQVSHFIAHTRTKSLSTHTHTHPTRCSFSLSFSCIF